MTAPATTAPEVLEVRGLTKRFDGRRGDGGHLALDRVDLTVRAGEAYALVGESGSGKTTLARCVLGLIPASAGTVRLDGRDLAAVRPGELRRLRRHAQIVFQNPHAALNPRMTVRELLAEPLRVAGTPRGEVAAGVVGLLRQVGLDAHQAGRHPHELSGGQCQRVAIARALAPRPRLLVLDEPTSALDVSVQAQLLNLLADLRAREGLAYLLISHDLGVVRHLADRVGVLRGGVLVEEGDTATVMTAPAHPYTRRLLASVPGRGRAALLAEALPPDGPSPPAGAPRAPAPLGTEHRTQGVHQ